MNYRIYVEPGQIGIFDEAAARALVGDRLIDDVNYSADLTCGRLSSMLTVVIDLTDAEPDNTLHPIPSQAAKLMPNY